MNDLPPHQAHEPGVQPDPTLQPDHKVSSVTTTIVALLGVAVVTLVLYGLNVSREPEIASNSPPAEAQDPAAASGNTAATNATDASKPDTGKAKIEDNSPTAQADRSNAPRGSQTQQPQTTTGQAPSTEKPGASPVRPNG
jgi:hypothetical protein